MVDHCHQWFFLGLLAWNWWSSSKTRRQYLNQKNPPFPPETNCQIEIATPSPHGHRSIGDWGQLRMLWSDQTTLHRTPSNVANWNWKNQTMTNTLGGFLFLWGLVLQKGLSVRRLQRSFLSAVIICWHQRTTGKIGNRTDGSLYITVFLRWGWP